MRGRPARHVLGRMGECALILAASGGLLWLVWIYGSGLRDPRYLDGWILAAGMGLQVYFHIAIKTTKLSPKSARRLRKVHILIGYVLIAAFLSHSDFSLPDTTFEWTLWVGFVLVTLSGIFGTYLSRALKTRHRIDDGVTFDRIPGLRGELAQELQSVVEKADPSAATIALPGLPHDAWIADLYVTHLRPFFQSQPNLASRLVGSQRPLKRMIGEIDSLSRYVDQHGQEKLAAIKSLVIEKDRLDFARTYLGLTKAWLFVHVPVTYALIGVTVLHVLVSYAYSSGAW